MKDLCEFMDEDDFNPELQLIADTCGRETALKLAEEFGGIQLYVPSNIVRNAKKRYIQANKSMNIVYLARKCDVSESFVSRLPCYALRAWSARIHESKMSRVSTIYVGAP